jgi:hypothetical protein
MPVRLIRRLLSIVPRSVSDEEPDPDDPVCVAHAPGEAVAGMWKSMLEDQGIPVILDAKTPPAGYARFGAGAAVNIELRVRRRDVERAAAVLGVDVAEG